jgi:putative ABC transport system ATP-binding protein
MSDRILKAERLSKTYRDSTGREFRAVQDVNLEVRKGEFVAIMGPSGSGKTTLANMLGLLTTPSQGRLSFLDHRIEQVEDQALTSFRRAYLGFVFQDYMLIEHMNVVENVALSMLLSSKPSAEIRKRARELLLKVGLRDHLHKYPSELSGGQKQRVAIARALVKKPKLILADEPAGALDARSRHEVLGLLQRLNLEQEATIVMVTHNSEDARAASRLISMAGGRIVSDRLIEDRADFRSGA